VNFLSAIELQWLILLFNGAAVIFLIIYTLYHDLYLLRWEVSKSV